MIPGNEHATGVLKKLIESGEAVAFVGAGASAELYPTWNALVEELGRAVKTRGFADKNDIDYWKSIANERPQQVVKQIRDKLGDQAFRFLIRDIFGRKTTADGKAFTSAQFAIASLPFKGLITTNYDHGLVEASAAARNEANVPLHSTWKDADSLSRWGSGDIFHEEKSPILFLHGSYHRTDTIILGLDDYRKAYNEQLFKSTFQRIWNGERLVFFGFGFKDRWMDFVVDDLVEMAIATEPRHIAIVGIDSEDAYSPMLRRSFQEAYNITPIFYVIDKDHRHSGMLELLQLLKPPQSTLSDSKNTSKMLSPLSLPDLASRARWETQQEITRSAQKKYIRDLYVRRRVEESVTDIFLDDDQLLQRCSLIREELYNFHVKYLDGLKMAIGSTNDSKSPPNDKQAKEARERQANIQKAYKEIDSSFDILLFKESLCDPEHRKLFGDLANRISVYDQLITKNPSHPSTRVLEQSSDFCKKWSSEVSVFVDRAGGGKTNLMCHLAEHRSSYTPTLYLIGRLPIERESDLLTIVLRRLGFPGKVPKIEIAQLKAELERSRSTLTILIDGINESRSIALLNLALQHLLTELSTLRTRFILTCRDIYWTFFEGESWTAKISSMVRNELYQFSATEQADALEKYLRHFNIEVVLGPSAKERCRHPLLLRFFCEAYGNVNGDKVKLGHRSEIRLKPLFDDYWKNKIDSLRSSLDGNEQSPENCLYSIVGHMMGVSAATVPTVDFPKITGVKDMTSDSSLFLRLLDEDIIIDEEPTNDMNHRTIVFVYEEFMEYCMARMLFARSKPGTDNANGLFQELHQKATSFVNALGVGEYLCSFFLDSKMPFTAIDMIVAMSCAGDIWDRIIANLFSKYDETLIAILAVDEACLKRNAKQFERILLKVDRPVLIEICAALLFRIAFPTVIKLDEIRECRLPPLHYFQTESLFHTDEKTARTLVKVVCTSLRQKGVCPGRDSLWAMGANKTNTVLLTQIPEMIKAISTLLRTSMRKDLINAFAFNGLFSSEVAIRRAAALAVPKVHSDIFDKLQMLVRAHETDQDVQTIMG